MGPLVEGPHRNLIHPVLMVMDEPIDVVTARLHVGAESGLLIADAVPELPNPLGVGVSLDFDRDHIPIRRGGFGPTEAVIDDLEPWLGTYTTRHLIADHRIRQLRFRRGTNPDANGVLISFWYVPDNEVEAPSGLRTRLQPAIGRR